MKIVRKYDVVLKAMRYWKLKDYMTTLVAKFGHCEK